MTIVVTVVVTTVVVATVMGAAIVMATIISIVVAALVVTMVIATMVAAVITAVVATVVPALLRDAVRARVLAGFVDSHGLVGHLVGELFLVVLGVRGATGEKGGDEQQCHRAFHLDLLGGSNSIRWSQYLRGQMSGR
jgi:hypothetical protein